MQCGRDRTQTQRNERLRMIRTCFQESRGGASGGRGESLSRRCPASDRRDATKEGQINGVRAATVCGRTIGGNSEPWITASSGTSQTARKAIVSLTLLASAQQHFSVPPLCAAQETQRHFTVASTGGITAANVEDIGLLSGRRSEATPNDAVKVPQKNRSIITAMLTSERLRVCRGTFIFRFIAIMTCLAATRQPYNTAYCTRTQDLFL